MNLYDILNELNIKYDEVSHDAVYTVDDAKEIENMISGIGCKNLFLKSKKGKYYLLILEENKRTNMSEVSKLVGSRLSFALESELESILNLKRGSVTPFGIINDKEYLVTLLIDRDLVDKVLLFHPNINTKTISIKYSDLIRFIEYCGNSFLII